MFILCSLSELIQAKDCSNVYTQAKYVICTVELVKRMTAKNSNTTTYRTQTPCRNLQLPNRHDLLASALSTEMQLQA